MPVLKNESVTILGGVLEESQFVVLTEDEAEVAKSLGYQPVPATVQGEDNPVKIILVRDTAQGEEVIKDIEDSMPPGD